jgi:uncharacterized protein YcfL
MSDKTKPRFSSSRFFARSRIFFPSVILALVVIGCSQVRPVTRNQLVENLAPIVEIEGRSSDLTMLYQRLKLIGWIKDEDSRALKEHYDVYYIYHKGAVVSLAQGDVETCKSLVRLADQELKSIETKLKSLLVNIRVD